MAAAYGQAGRPRHPVEFDVEYPERSSRLLLFVRLILAIPQLIAAYLLSLALSILTVMAWFAILFTGRYPKGMFDFNAGVLRWQANVFSYVVLLRDEYPPFSWEPGEYPLHLDIPRAERQSRFRLFIRAFAIVPNYLVFYFVQFAFYLTTIIAWFAILFTGRYPRGLFRFNVGVGRWYQRMAAYLYLLRDEFPPYSISAEARPGNEVVSAIIGVPLFAAYTGFYIVISIMPLLQGSETVSVDRALLETPERFASVRPSVESGNLRITIANMTPRLPCPDRDPDRMAACFSVEVEIEKDGWRPALYIPLFFSVEYCFDAPGRDNRSSPLEVTGDQFHWWWFGDGKAESTLYFELGPISICELSYFSGTGTLNFEFE